MCPIVFMGFILLLVLCQKVKNYFMQEINKGKIRGIFFKKFQGLALKKLF
jgi:hypothetical protein